MSIIIKVLNNSLMTLISIIVYLRVFFNCELYNGKESEINKIS